MSEDKSAAQQGDMTGNVHVPADVMRAFPDLIELLLHSESMNDEERRYWIDILPVMTPDQVVQLKDILTNERDQLTAIDAKYAKELDAAGMGTAMRSMEESRREKKQKLQSQENVTREEEEKKADQILKDLE